MLKVNNLSISFGDKNIFDNANFIALDGKITGIIGGSGKGKSTLLKTLLFEYPCDYYHNDRCLTELSNDEKRGFIFQNVSYISQIPQFVNDFTIKQHIGLIKKVYGITDDRDNYLEELGIDKILDKYPKQLSGGQKTRASIYLGLLKKPEILILDEPTASLDRDNVSKVINILVDYCKLGHTVIVSSHDNQLIKQCDVQYEINNCKLSIVSELIESTDKFDNKVNFNFSKKGYYDYWRLLESRHKYYNIIMMVLLSLSILITIFSNNFSMGANSTYKDQLNSLSSLEMIVYKEKAEGEYFSFSGEEFPFSEAELDEIKQIKHIKNVKWSYHTIIDREDLILLNTSYNVRSDENLMNVSLYDKEEVVVQNKNLNDCEIGFRTFTSPIDKKNIKNNFNDTGIVISNELFKKITNGKEVEHPYLEFIALIPKYDATDLTHVYPLESDQEPIPCNMVLGEYRKIKLPIASVVNNDAYINGVPIPEYCIYINRDKLEEYINDSYPNEGRILYEVLNEKGEYLMYYNSVPENTKADSITLTTTQSPWRPNSYIIEVDDISNFNKVAKEVSELGYGIESRYIDSKSFNILSEQNKHVLTISIIAIFVLMYAFYIYLKYLTISNQSGLNDFLKALGLSDIQINKLNRQRYIYKALKLFLLTSLLFVVIVQIAVNKQIISFIIKPGIEIFIYIFVISILIEVILPRLLEKIHFLRKKRI